MGKAASSKLVGIALRVRLLCWVGLDWIRALKERGGGGGGGVFGGKGGGGGTGEGGG